MKKIIYESGQIIGDNCIFISEVKSFDRNRRGIFKCRCGNEWEAYLSAINNKSIKSCGCLQKEITSKRSKSHGMSKHEVYKIWIDIKKRCYNENSKRYHDYGARGIFMDDEFKNNFNSFYEHVGERPSKYHTIDRIDNSKGYIFNNIKWSTIKEQNNNQRSNVVLTFNGENKTAAQWGDIYGIKGSAIRKRLARGWSIDKSITTPIK